MARTPTNDVRLDSPKGMRTPVLGNRGRPSRDRFGRFTEGVARASVSICANTDSTVSPYRA